MPDNYKETKRLAKYIVWNIFGVTAFLVAYENYGQEWWFVIITLLYCAGILVTLIMWLENGLSRG
jgi:hypothetical protein